MYLVTFNLVLLTFDCQFVYHLIVIINLSITREGLHIVCSLSLYSAVVFGALEVDYAPKG